MTNKPKTTSSNIENPLDLVRGLCGKPKLKGVTISDARVRTDVIKRTRPHSVTGSKYQTINKVGAVVEITLSYSAGFDAVLKTAYISKENSNHANTQRKSMSISDVIKNATFIPDFFDIELGDDLVENYSIIITDEAFRTRLVGIDSSLCQYWEDKNEKAIYIDDDNDVRVLLEEYDHAFKPNPDPKRKHLTKKLLSEIDKAVKAEMIKFLKA